MPTLQAGGSGHGRRPEAAKALRAAGEEEYGRPGSSPSSATCQLWGQISAPLSPGVELWVCCE